MTWLPIAQVVPQEFDSNGDPYVGAVYKFYSAGTSTNINLATDSTGGTTATSVALNANGNPAVSGSVIIPHVEEAYKIAFYPNQTAADADSGAIYTVDNINPADLIDTDTDVLAKVSSNDTTAGYLNGKLVAGANVSLTEGSDGGNETLTVALDTNFQDGHLYGLGTSRETINDIAIAVGSCVDSTNAFSMSLTSVITKQIDANWAEGDDAGGFPSGLTVATGTTYHIFLIAKTNGTVDAGFDTSLSAANLLSDASDYTYYRRIASIVTDASTASTIVLYYQTKDKFIWDVPPTDLSTSTIGTSEVDLAMSVPTGIQVDGIFRYLHGEDSAGFGFMVLRSTNMADTAPDNTHHTSRVASGAVSVTGDVLITTDTSGQITYRGGVSGHSLSLFTIGWYDDRGKL